MEQIPMPARPPRRSDRQQAPQTSASRPQDGRTAAEATWAIDARSVSPVSRMASGMERSAPAAGEDTASATIRRPAQSQPYASAPAPRRVTASGTVPERPRQASSPVRTAPPPQVERSTRRSGNLQARTSQQAVQKTRKADSRMPVWITAGMIVCLLSIMACIAGELIMTGWLRQQQEKRDAAERRIVETHPIQYTDMIERYAAEYNLQPAFVAAIIMNESSYNSHAESGVGARGLMQLMPDTAEWIAHKLNMGAGWTPDKLWDPETNIRFGCWYLRYLSNMFSGDPVTVTSAYHTGQGQVNTWLNNATYSPDGKALRLESMPDGPTKTYAGRVIRDYGIYDFLYFHVFNEAQDEPA